MIRRAVRRAAAEGPHVGAVPPERARAWAANFPPNAARRMTRLGLMLGETLREFPIAPADAVIYASTYGETMATERYLDGFPSASPLYFQVSIHPSAIEQVLINRGCPVRELTPLAGQDGLAAQAALTALLTPGERVLLTGGEEIGDWLLKLQAASDTAFAFALELGGDEDGGESIGALSWQPEPSDASPATLPDLFAAVAERRPWRCACPAGGEIALEWN